MPPTDARSQTAPIDVAIRALACAAACVATVALLGCSGSGGSGGGSEPPVVNTAVYDLRQANSTFEQARAGARSFTTSGRCTGSETHTYSALVPGSFQGVAGYSRTVEHNGTSTCPQAASTGTALEFLDSQHVLIGYTSTAPSDALARPAGGTSAFPSAARVGDSGSLGTLATYADLAATQPSGREDTTWALTAQTADTALLTVTTRHLDTGGTLIHTTTARYRISADHRATLLDIGHQAAGDSEATVITPST